VALVSDAGTPAISDPGFKLVREAIREDIRVVPSPAERLGGSALFGRTAHQQVPVRRIPPPKAVGLRKSLAALEEQDGTLIFYLPGRKLAEFLGAVLETLGDRDVVIARELTKIHEEFVAGSALSCPPPLDRNSKAR